MVPSSWVGLAPVAAAHEPDGQKLIDLGQRPQRCDARIEMRTGAELDMLRASFHPVGHRDEARNAEIAGDVEQPEPAPGLGKLSFQVANIGIVELGEIDLGPLKRLYHQMA